jgi:ankyrin repeat protein
VLFDEHINIAMLKLLLEYNPQLNYIVHYYDMTPLQVIASGKYENLEALKMLLDNGADPNFVGNSNRSKNTPLILSYVRDKIETFSALLKSRTNYEMPNNNIYDAITSSYGLYLQNHGIDLRNFYNKHLCTKTASVLHSFGYKTVHRKNMQYLALLQQHIQQTKKVSCAPKKLIKWYIKTQENKALESLMSHYICKRVLVEMKEFAIQLNNRATMNLLNNKQRLAGV